MKSTIWTTMAAAGLLLAGCGGGGGGEAQPPLDAGRELPAAATASTQALVKFAASLGADDRAEPLSLAGVVLPRDDGAEPLPVN